MGSKGADDAAAGSAIGDPGEGGCSGLGDDGRLKLYNMLTTNDGNPFLVSIQPEDPTAARQTNFTGDLGAAFGQLAKVGAGGCGFEQHLEAIKQALEPSNSANVGFLRPDAFLAVIIIADEDDCSLSHSTLLAPDSATLGARQSFRCTRFGITCDDGGKTSDEMNQVGPKSQCHPDDGSAYLTKVADYVTFLKGLKDDPSKVIVAGIVGTIDPFAVELRAPDKSSTAIPALAHSCTYTGNDGKPEVADPPIRIKSFLDQFPNRNTFSSICQQDLRGGLQQIAELLRAVVGDPCIEGKLADPPNYDCAVSSIVNPGTDTAVETVLPRCDTSASNPPCWHIITDATQCADPATDHLVLKVEGQETLPTDSHIVANCVTEAN
jgi:hypothetical protein